MKVFFLFLFLFSWGLSADMLIIEYKRPSDSVEHAHHVEDIACNRFSKKRPCHSIYTKYYLDSFLKKVNAIIDHVQVVNMSFAYYEPLEDGKASLVNPEKAEQGLKNFHIQNSNFKKLFTNNQNVLFVMSAGNGHILTGPKSVPLNYRFSAYPLRYHFQNTIKVAAMSLTNEDELADYSNFSLWEVDLAAHVPMGKNNKIIKGTSFAAPHVSQMAYDILEKHPILSPYEVKTILMKSSYIKNIDAAVSMSMNYMADGESSLAARVHNTFNSKEREKLRRKLSSVLLVKSGGIANFQTAMLCADLYTKDKLSLSEACLRAQSHTYKRTHSELQKIKFLWELRQF